MESSLLQSDRGWGKHSLVLHNGICFQRLLGQTGEEMSVSSPLVLVIILLNWVEEILFYGWNKMKKKKAGEGIQVLM